MIVSQGNNYHDGSLSISNADCLFLKDGDLGLFLVFSYRNLIVVWNK